MPSNPGEDYAGAGEESEEDVGRVAVDEAAEDDGGYHHQHAAEHGLLPTEAIPCGG